jgi:peptidoglycan/LPS O-acetylase OafA/YrhL
MNTITSTNKVPDGANNSYMPQLDALRFFAVLGVLVVHNWRPQKLPWIFGELDWGNLGVRLFFVLSGFLITGILLDCRNLAESSPSPGRLFYVKQFYIRRFLRIFPIYYLVLFICLFLDLPPAREVWTWLATYTSNFYITLNGEWIGRLGHFWTLAVEEQFYFVWPWMIIFLPRKWLIPFILMVITLAPIYRSIAVYLFPHDIVSGEFTKGTFTISSLDCLGAGALLALFFRSKHGPEKVQRLLRNLFLPAVLILYGLILTLKYYNLSIEAYYILGDTLAAVFFCWLVGAASKGFSGGIGNILENKTLVSLGKITYGIYVYHNFVPEILLFIFNKLGYSYQTTGFTNFILSSIFSILIAQLSWILIEKPINNLKRYFSYKPKYPFIPTAAET